jgi:hypothetical protein
MAKTARHFPSLSLYLPCMNIYVLQRHVCLTLTHLEDLSNWDYWKVCKCLHLQQPSGKETPKECNLARPRVSFLPVFSTTESELL